MTMIKLYQGFWRDGVITPAQYVSESYAPRGPGKAITVAYEGEPAAFERGLAQIKGLWCLDVHAKDPALVVRACRAAFAAHAHSAFTVLQTGEWPEPPAWWSEWYADQRRQYLERLKALAVYVAERPRWRSPCETDAEGELFVYAFGEVLEAVLGTPPVAFVRRFDERYVPEWRHYDALLHFRHDGRAFRSVAQAKRYARRELEYDIESEARILQRLGVWEQLGGDYDALQATVGF